MLESNSDYIQPARLQAQITSFISNLQFEKKFRPPERQSVPINVELEGFQKDIRGAFEKTLSPFLTSLTPVNRIEIADALTELSNKQHNNSAGPVTRFSALSLRDTLCPDYIKNIVTAELNDQHNNMPISQILDSLEKDATPEQKDILTGVRKQVGEEEIPINRLRDHIESVASDLEFGDDSYMSEEGDILLGKLKTAFQANHQEIGLAVDEIKQIQTKIRPGTETWVNPIQNRQLVPS